MPVSGTGCAAPRPAADGQFLHRRPGLVIGNQLLELVGSNVSGSGILADALVPCGNQLLNPLSSPVRVSVGAKER